MTTTLLLSLILAAPPYDWDLIGGREAIDWDVIGGPTDGGGLEGTVGRADAGRPGVSNAGVVQRTRVRRSFAELRAIHDGLYGGRPHTWPGGTYDSLYHHLQGPNHRMSVEQLTNVVERRAEVPTATPASPSPPPTSPRAAPDCPT